MDEPLEGHILRQLSLRASTPEHLATDLQASADDLSRALDDLERRGWVSRGPAWYGNDPSSGIEIVYLKPAGREEATRRDILRATLPVDEPIKVTREELLEELDRRGFPRRDLEIHPTLRGPHFYFWPSVGAYADFPE